MRMECGAYGDTVTKLLLVLVLGFAAPGSTNSLGERIPPPPSPERIIVSELPLPPAVGSDTPGACSEEINPHHTGCIAVAPLSAQSGSFLPDGHHILVKVTYAGAPAPPDPGSVYRGTQIVLIKADGARFANGDSWKCLTCGVPGENAKGVNDSWDYPQSFRDGKRALAGTNIIDCSPLTLADEACGTNRVHVYPIRWNTHPDGTGPGGSLRELRIHPDGEHIGFNAFTFEGGQLGQNAYIGRLVFDASPHSGEPMAPRYDLDDVIGLFRDGQRYSVLKVDPAHPHELLLDYQTIAIGEFRGFSKNGNEVFYVGPPYEASNIDMFAVDLKSGRVRRLTSHPEYVDPIDSSPDDKWFVIEDTRGSGRQMFMAAMRGVPPITDLVTSSVVSSIRNNGERRFFQPFLLDHYGDRDHYYGQRLNAGDGARGSPSDPNWNAMADPRWSYDGTKVVFWQAQVVSPACGGTDPLPCPPPTERDGRRYRVMLASFPGREAIASVPAPSFDESVPWGTRYVPGARPPRVSLIPEGSYTLKGRISGVAKVEIHQIPGRNRIGSVAVEYHNYSDEKGLVLNGTESAEATSPKPTVTSLLWRSKLVETGKTHATKLTSDDGFKVTIDVLQNVFHGQGALTTTVDGKTYRQPLDGH